MAMADPNVVVQVLETSFPTPSISPPEKNIFVRLTRAAKGVRCEVQDEGPGLSPEDQKKLFGRFAPQCQAHRRRTLDRIGFVDREEDGRGDERESLVRKRAGQGRDVHGGIAHRTAAL
jgi:hypothetical protein